MHICSRLFAAALLSLSFLTGIMQAAHADYILEFHSDPGDYIGQGQEWKFDDTNAVFGLRQNYGDPKNGITINVNSKNGMEWFYLSFDPADPGLLQVGVYKDATRFPFNYVGNGLDVSGSGRGCNTLQGEFEVKSLGYDEAGNINSAYIDFVQHCEGMEPALRGTIVYNATRYPLCSTIKPTRENRSKLARYRSLGNQMASLQARIDRMTRDLEALKKTRAELSKVLQCQ